MALRMRKETVFVAAKTLYFVLNIRHDVIDTEKKKLASEHTFNKEENELKDLDSKSMGIRIMHRCWMGSFCNAEKEGKRTAKSSC